jgi:hypothetical protein
MSAEAMKALDGCEPGAEPGRSLRVAVIGLGGIVHGAQKQGTGRDPPVLIGRKCRHAQSLERGWDSIAADRPQEVGDDQVFGEILKPLQAVDDVLVEEPAKAQVKGLHDGLDHQPL